MDPFERLFQDLPSHKVIVCKRCQYAVVPIQVNGHVQRHHPSITKNERESIVRTVEVLLDVAQQPDDVQYPSIESPPVKGLPVWKDGLRCMTTTFHGVCNYVCREKRVMTRHCRQQHQWKNPRKRGGDARRRPSEDIGRLWIDSQPCQRFFKTGKWQRYFVVQGVGELSSQSQSSISYEQESQHGKTILDGLFHRFEQAREQDTNNQRRRFEPNPWLEHTMWESHIGPYKEWAVRMAKPDGISESVESGGEANNEASVAITASEEALEQACKATATLIRRSYEISRIEIVGRPAMHYVNRRETGAPTSDRPFYGKQKVQTIRKYTDRFVRILRYIWRTESIEERPKYRLTATQQDTLAEFRRVAARVAEEEKARPVHTERQAKRRGRLVAVSCSFWIAMFDHRLGDEEYESAVLSGLAVLGADGEGGGWMPAINYTPILAAMITTMRAIVIRRAWCIRRNQIQTNVRNGIPERHAREGVPSVFDIAKKDVEKFMTMTEFGGHPTPMNTIYVHKMYGMKIRYTTKAEGQISWEGEDTVLVRKIKFSMSDIRSAVHGLLSIVRKQLVEELFMFTSNTGPGEWKPSEMPRFDIGKISDNHRMLDEGWSFLKDVRNEWAVNGERWMGMRLFENSSVRQRLIRSQSTAVVEYNADAVATYLRAVKKFKEKLIVLVHMSAEAPARFTELISV